MSKYILDSSIILLLFIWSWPGIEQLEIFKENRIILLGLVILFISLRNQILFTFKWILRRVRKTIYFKVNNLKSFFTNKPSDLEHLNLLLFCGEEITPSVEGKRLSDYINLQMFDEAKLLVTELTEPNVNFRNFNEYFRIGVHFSNKYDINGLHGYMSPLVHLSKEQGAKYFIDEYDEFVDHKRIDISSSLINNNISRTYTIEIKAGIDNTVILFKSGVTTIFERSMNPKYHLLKFAIWTDVKDNTQIRLDDKTRELIYSGYPVFLQGSIEVRK